MYQIKVWRPGVSPAFLYDPRDEDFSLIDPILTQELNKSGTLTFDVYPGHPNADKIRKMACEIGIFQDGAEKPIYVGRPLEDVSDMETVSTITCEGILAYLLDSIVRPFEYTGGIRGMLEQFLASHNAQVDEWKRFRLGEVTVADSNNYINRSSSEYLTTLEAINTRLIKTHGGYLRIRFEDDGRYLDYIADYGHVNTQAIEFGENLLDLKKHISPDGLVTAIIPLGADTEEDGINNTKKPLTISSVNGGNDCLVDEAAAEEFGLIYGTVRFENLTLPQNLKAKGQAYLSEHNNLVHSLEIQAVDLHAIDVDIERFNLGDWVPVRSKRHGLDKLFPVTAITKNLADPAANSLTLGRKLETFTAETTKAQGEITNYVIETAKQTNSVLMEAIQIATELITGGRGGYLIIDRAEDGHPQGILIMDHPEREDAVNVIQINKNGIGFSTSGINGPYSNAWTIDGVLNASFIKAGTLDASRISVTNLSASSITTGTMSTSRISGLTTFVSNQLGGYVTEDELAGNGTTTINGGNITTGVINILDNGGTGGLKISGTSPTGDGGGFAAAEGNDGKRVTYGAKVYGVGGQYYCIATNAGVCLRGPSASLYVSGGSIHASTAISEGSDRRIKNSISHDLEKYLEFFEELKPAVYKFNEGTSDRYHIGFIAQDVEEALDRAGLTSKDFAGLVIDTHEDPEHPGRWVEEYGLRYTEFVSLNTYMLQKAFQRIEALENKISELEGRINGSDS